MSLSRTTHEYYHTNQSVAEKADAISAWRDALLNVYVKAGGRPPQPSKRALAVLSALSLGADHRGNETICGKAIGGGPEGQRQGLVAELVHVKEEDARVMR